MPEGEKFGGVSIKGWVESAPPDLHKNQDLYIQDELLTCDKQNRICDL